MSPDTLVALAVYAFITSVTPGPNNIMLLASGVNFGFRRTIPHMLGISLGFALLLAAVGLGLGALLTAFQMLHTAVKVAGCVYLLYLAWRIGSSRSLARDGETAARPMRLHEAAAFQWVNPKAWVLAVSAMAVYTDPEHPLLTILIVLVTFTAINLPSVSCWAGFGMALRGFLAEPARLKWFNIGMGLLLAATIWPMLS
jgi:threonine/homoserine/homoserine lactone efflux protein